MEQEKTRNKTSSHQNDTETLNQIEIKKREQMKIIEDVNCTQEKCFSIPHSCR